MILDLWSSDEYGDADIDLEQALELDCHSPF